MDITEPKDIYPVILAGGAGTGLWPLSRKLYPKQFLQLKEFGGYSLFQKALLRASLFSEVENFRILTSTHYRFNCQVQAEEIGFKLSPTNLITECESHGTLPALSLGLRNIPDSATVITFPSDQVMDHEAYFHDIALQALQEQPDGIITFAITPTEANTGYSYIYPEESHGIVKKVLQFWDRPDMETAKEYMQSGYLWNTGIYLFKRSTFMSELRKHMSEYLEIIESDISESAQKFKRFPKTPIDRLLERSTNHVFTVPLGIGWADFGTFDSLKQHKKGFGNGSVIEIGGENNYSVAETGCKPVLCVGVSDLIVVDTADAILVTREGKSSLVKEALPLLEEKFKPLLEQHTTRYKPWGNSTVIDRGDHHKAQRLVIWPGRKISLQLHHHKMKHWVLIHGSVRATNGDKEIILSVGESTLIPLETKHRIENIGTETAIVMENQIGENLTSEDVVRFEDDFGRVV